MFAQPMAAGPAMPSSYLFSRMELTWRWRGLVDGTDLTGLIILESIGQCLQHLLHPAGPVVHLLQGLVQQAQPVSMLGETSLEFVVQDLLPVKRLGCDI